MKISKAGICLRGALYLGIAVTGFLANDANFRQAVTPNTLTVVGVLSVSFLALRAFIDTSNGDAKTNEPTPVTVENTSADPVQTTEVESNETFKDA